jgi:hypothetical protein
MTNPVALLSQFKPLESLSQSKLSLTVSAEGLEKNGKTTFVGSAPEPLVIFTTDFAGIRRAQLDKRFPGKDIRVEVLPEIDMNAHADNIKSSAKKAVDDFKSKWDNALRAARSVGVDNASDLWLLFRLAEFGRTKIDSRTFGSEYDGINADFTNVIRQSYKCAVNVILLHQVNAQRDEKGKITAGSYSRKGFRHLGPLVDELVYLYRNDDNGDFMLRVIESGFNSSLRNLEWKTNPDVAFIDYALKVFPQSTPDQWL